MNSTHTVLQKMDLIQSIFRSVQDGNWDRKDFETLPNYLNSFNDEFRSIAYEAASMQIALADLEEENNLQTWQTFLKHIAQQHVTQAHIGLGWALAQNQHNPLVLLPKLHPMHRYRVLDGYGYYEGLFRKRKTMVTMQPFDGEDLVAKQAYDQGLGRYLWYLNKADINATSHTIKLFDEKRQKDLLRGVGIACTYVGGLDKTTLNEVKEKVEEWSPQLIAGTMMAAISRHKANSVNYSTELHCSILAGKCLEEIIQMDYDITQKVITAEDAYHQWVKSLEERN